MNTPTPAEYAGGDRAVAQCRETGKRASIPTEKGDAYAYPHRDGIAWGINGGPFGILIDRGLIRDG